MGFAGTNCIVYLSDGRRIVSPSTREELTVKLERVSSRWPLMEIRDDLGNNRYIAGAHVVELKPTDAGT